MRSVALPPAPVLMPSPAIAADTFSKSSAEKPAVCATVGSKSSAVASRSAFVPGQTTPIDLAFHTSGSPEAATVSVRPISISGGFSGHETRQSHRAGLAAFGSESGSPPRSESHGTASPAAGHSSAGIDGNAKPACIG